MTKVKAWIGAMRLRTLPLSLSGIIAGSFIAFSHNSWSTVIFILSLFTTVFLQVLSNLANDLGDSLNGADNENRVGPKRAVQSGEISVFQMKIGVAIFVFLSLSTAVPLIIFGTKNMNDSAVWIYAGLAVFSIIAAITYTVGKKAYGYHGMGDLMVFIFFGWVAVVGVYGLYAKTINWNVALFANVVGFLSVAVLNLNNMRDHVNDANSGKNTIVVKLGFTKAKVYHGLVILFAFLNLIVFILLEKNYLSFISLLPFILIFKHLNFVSSVKNPKDLDKELKKVALSTFLITILFALSVILWN